MAAAGRARLTERSGVFLRLGAGNPTLDKPTKFEVRDGKF